MTLRFLNIRTLQVVAGIFLNLALLGQAIPSGPLSIPVYHPVVLNPAYAGSKDFTNIGFTTKALKNPNYQLLSAHSRLMNANGSFSNFGLGGYTFVEQLDQSWNTGLSLAASYHYTLDDSRLHNLSGGAALKGIFTVPKSSDEAVEDTLSTTFTPDMDLGFYYYGPNAFGGVSVNSLFDQSRGFHLYGGYKFLLNRSLAIVLEPSLLISFVSSSGDQRTEQITPYLKLYMQNFYVGTYVKSDHLFALFFQYQFPRFYTGVFLEFPWKGYLNDDNIIFELSVGINLGLEKQKFLQHRHW
jgi:hypothetical protein